MDKIKNQKERSSTNLENSSNQQEKFKSSTKFYDNVLRNLESKMTPAQLKTNDIAISDAAFSLTKRELFDAVLLRYGWDL